MEVSLYISKKISSSTQYFILNLKITCGSFVRRLSLIPFVNIVSLLSKQDSHREERQFLRQLLRPHPVVSRGYLPIWNQWTLLNAKALRTFHFSYLVELIYKIPEQKTTSPITATLLNNHLYYCSEKQHQVVIV